jgi:PAS domain S-box-containing protein
MPDEATQGPTETLRLCDFIEAHQELLLRRWERASRQMPAAQPLSQASLRDHIPQLLDRLGKLVRTVHEGGEVSLEGLSTLHALERLDIGFDLRHVTRELALLRSIILETWEESIALDRQANTVVKEIRKLDGALDHVVTASVDAYARARERTLVAVERISAAALGTGDLDTFLPKLLKVLLETTAAADVVRVFIRHEDLLRLRACAGIVGPERDLPELPIHEGFAGMIVQAGEPRLIHCAFTDEVVHDPGIRSREVRALYGVPLKHEDRVIGVAEMGSRTAYDFSPDDKQLFRAMVQRATSIIAQAQLLERERHAHALAAEYHARLKAILSAATIGVAFLDAELRYQIVNERLAEFNGLPVEEHIGKRVSEIVAPHQRQPIEDALRTLLDTRAPIVNLETSLANTEGSSQARHFLMNAYPVCTEGERLLGVGVLVTEITDLEEAHQALERSEARFRRMANTVPAFLSEADPTGSNIWTSEPWYAYTGLTPEQCKGLGWVEALHPDDRPELEQRWQAAVQQGATFEAVTRFRRHDGQYRWFQVRAVPERDAQGAIVRWLGTVSDVDERARAQHALKESHDFERQLIGIVSHDLRTPLTAILMTANTLLRRQDIDNRLRNMAERIISSGNRATRMIRDLLDFAQARAGATIPIQRHRLRLGELVHQIVDEIQLGYPGRTIGVDEEGDTEGEWDPDRIAQIVANLVGNALQHSPSGSPVGVLVAGEPQTVVLTVHNEGPPIPDETMASLFDPYKRGARSSGAKLGEGVGLGLFITKSLVDAKGGTIAVSSTPHGGTTFQVRLPRHVSPGPQST